MNHAIAVLKPTVFLIFLGVARLLCAEEVSIQADNNGYLVTTPKYEAVVSADGCLTHLRIDGLEFLKPVDTGSCGSYFYYGGKLKLPDIEQVGHVITAKGEQATIRYEFGVDSMVWSLQNLESGPMPFYIIFDPAVSTVMDKNGDFAQTPLEKDGGKTVWFREQSRLEIDDCDRLWPWRGNLQVLEVMLAPKQERRISLNIGVASPAEAGKTAAGNDPAHTPAVRSEIPAQGTGSNAPTMADVPYGRHPKQVLHFWKAKSDKPTPLLVEIHGGGWIAGNRFSGLGDLLKPMLDAGISVVSLEYRFIAEAMRDGVTPPVKAPMRDVARALQFVRSKAAEWNIDKSRIAVSGSSAGGCSALWLAFHDDLADPTSIDPVARESTRVLCAAVHDAQTTLDPQQMREWIPRIDYGSHAFGILKKAAGDPPTAEPGRFAMDFDAFLAQRERLLPWISEYSPCALLTPDDPPVYLIYDDPPAPDEMLKTPAHSAFFGVKLQEKTQAAGVACELVYPGAADGKHSTIQDYLINKLKTSFLEIPSTNK
jgi:acetyl esterase/lipase